MGPPSHVTGREADGAPRYRPEGMVLHACVCRAPSGRDLPVLVVDEYVIAPESSRTEVGLGWLELEGHARLTSEAASQLQRGIDGFDLGSWPFCVPITRWDNAAQLQPFLRLDAVV